MATLATDKPRVYENTGGHPSYNGLPVIATDIIYDGAAVSVNSSGFARPLTVADATFAGFAQGQIDNSTGAAGARNVNLIDQGRVKLSVAGVTSVADVNDPVYATDDDTFTLTATGGVAIGKIARWESGTIVLVDFESTNRRSI